MGEIAIVNQDSGYLMIDIANACCKAGYQVSLITGRLNQRSTPLDPGIEVRHIIKYNRSNSLKRLFTWSVAALQILFLLWFRYRNHRLLLVSNPPFAPLLPLLTRNKFDILIYDLYPDALVEMGYFKRNSVLIKTWESLNKKACRKAERVFTISEGMRSAAQKYAGSKVIEVVPLWTDNSLLKPLPANENPFRLKHRLTDKIVVMYSGNLGLTHNVGLIPVIAKRIQDERIFFLIVGEGAQKKQLAEKIEAGNLKNILLLPLQPQSELPFSLACADIALITLGSGASQLSVPSKTYNFMSVGAALLCIAGRESELAGLVARYNNGVCYQPDQIDEICETINKLAQDEAKLQHMKSASLQASKDFGVENAMKFVAEFQS